MLSGVCVPVLMSEPWYWLPVSIDSDLEDLRDALLFLLAVRLADDPPFDAVFLAGALFLAAALAGGGGTPLLAFLAAAFLGAAFFGAAFFGAAFFGAAFLGAAFFAAAFLGAAFLAAAFLGAAFFGAAFLAAPFLAATPRDEDLLAPPLDDFEALLPAVAFLAALFDEPPLPEVEPPRLDLAAPFLEALLEDDLPPALLLDAFLAAAFLVDFAILMGF